LKFDPNFILKLPPNFILKFDPNFILKLPPNFILKFAPGFTLKLPPDSSTSVAPGFTLEPDPGSLRARRKRYKGDANCAIRGGAKHNPLTSAFIRRPFFHHLISHL
jgi:hypothetical protein